MYKESIEKIRKELDKVFEFAKLNTLTPPPTSFDLGGLVYESKNFSHN